MGGELVQRLNIHADFLLGCRPEGLKTKVLSRPRLGNNITACKMWLKSIILVSHATCFWARYMTCNTVEPLSAYQLALDVKDGYNPFQLFVMGYNLHSI